MTESARLAERPLPEGEGIDIVVHDDGEAGSSPENAAQGEAPELRDVLDVLPDRPGAHVDDARGADADAQERMVELTSILCEAPHDLQEVLQDSLAAAQPVGGDGAGVLDHPPGIHQAARQGGPPQIHADDDASAGRSHARFSRTAARSP